MAVRAEHDDTGIFRPRLLVATEPVTGDPLEVTSPWNGNVVGVVPTVGRRETEAAIDAAHDAGQRGLPAHERAEVLDVAANTLRERRQEFARLLALEIGKPVAQGLVEVDRCVQTLKFSAVEARTITGTGVAFDAHPAGVGRRGFTIRVPIGVVGAITPFNFPLNLAAHKVGPAIAAGCGVVLKPSREAPLAAAELANLLYDAGLPPEWLSVVVGPSGEIADALVEDHRVAMITFTGSSDVGWGLAGRAPRKRVRLELGNSTPVIVCADGDISKAAAAVAASGFGFAGQSCISVQRVIVETAVHDDFVEALRTESLSKRVGDPLDAETHVGPLINAQARDRVVGWIEEAEDRGARNVTAPARDGDHLAPVILDDISLDVRAWGSEIFGPVVGIHTFDGFDEAVTLANDTEYGLQAGVFTSNLSTALEATERLDFGGVTINETPTFRVDQMPYGGTKESGNTREGPHYAVAEMTEERVVVIGG
ncbi:MAG: aldehyde dehydrogenase family protein [Acidimicrobiales bacterium]